MGKLKIEVFLTHLAVEKNVAPSTQNQAFNVLVFLYEHVLELSLKETQITSVRAKQKVHIPIPVVLSKDELKRILLYTSGNYKLMLMLLYGCGLRLVANLERNVKPV